MTTKQTDESTTADERTAFEFELGLVIGGAASGMDLSRDDVADVLDGAANALRHGGFDGFFDTEAADE